MTTKTLVYSMLGICIVTILAYISIAPLAKKSLEAPSYLDMNQEEQLEQEIQKQNTPSQTNIATSVPKTLTEQKITETPSTKQVSFSMQDVALHNSESSCWSVVNGVVYDLTSYISKHPGGSRAVIRICGVDGTGAFEGQHGGQSKPERILENYKIGNIK